MAVWQQSRGALGAKATPLRLDPYHGYDTRTAPHGIRATTAEFFLAFRRHREPRNCSRLRGVHSSYILSIRNRERERHGESCVQRLSSPAAMLLGWQMGAATAQSA